MRLQAALRYASLESRVRRLLHRAAGLLDDVRRAVSSGVDSRPDIEERGVLFKLLR